MRIRLLAPDELTEVQALERAAGQPFRDIGMPEIADDDPPSTEVLLDYVLAGRAWAAGDGPMAYLLAEPVDGNLHIEQVSVHPDHARQGIGRALIEHVATLAPALTLTTFTEVPWNAPYYARCGFRELTEAELTPGLRRIRAREIANGLHRWPRTTMRRDP